MDCYSVTIIGSRKGLNDRFLGNISSPFDNSFSMSFEVFMTFLGRGFDCCVCLILRG